MQTLNSIFQAELSSILVLFKSIMPGATTPWAEAVPDSMSVPSIGVISIAEIETKATVAAQFLHSELYKAFQPTVRN